MEEESRMRQLFVKNDDFSLEKPFSFFNRPGDAEYHLEQYEDDDTAYLVLLNEKKEMIGKVSKENTKGATKYVGMTGVGEELFLLRQEKTDTSNGFVFSSPVFELCGQWWEFNYDVMYGYRKVAKVRKRWVHWGPSHEITLFEEQSELFTLLLVAAFLYLENEKNNNSALYFIEEKKKES